MNSIARFLFFIALSAALHLLGLSFNLTAPGMPFKSHSIGIGYVSRSLDSFYPVPISINPPSHSVESLTTDKDSAISTSKHRPIKVDSPVEPVVSPPVSHIKNGMNSSPISIQKDTILTGRKRPAPASSPGSRATQTYRKVVDLNDCMADENVADSDGQSKPAVIGDSVSTVSGRGSSSGQMTLSQLSYVPEGNIISWKISTDAIPRYDLNPVPHYPEVARLRSWEGKVVFEALILKTGRVGHLNLLASSGHYSLDNAARKAIARWQFKPAISSGRAIDSQVEIPITFSLKDL